MESAAATDLWWATHGPLHQVGLGPALGLTLSLLLWVVAGVAVVAIGPWLWMVVAAAAAASAAWVRQRWPTVSAEHPQVHAWAVLDRNVVIAGSWAA